MDRKVCGNKACHDYNHRMKNRCDVNQNQETCDKFILGLEWISVEDLLPEQMQRVLTYHKRGEIRLHRWIKEDREDFTHWMPLPDPPDAK